MHLKSLIQGLDGIIPGGISFLDFAIVAKIDQISSKEILNVLVANGIGSFEKNLINFTSGDKLNAALFTIKIIYKR